MKPSELKPQKIKNTCGGNCENCGKVLVGFEWVFWGNTACTRNCVMELYGAEMFELSESLDS